MLFFRTNISKKYLKEVMLLTLVSDNPSVKEDFMNHFILTKIVFLLRICLAKPRTQK